MKKTLLTIITGAVAAILGTLISDKLLQINIFDKLSAIMIFFVRGEIAIPRWFFTLTLMSILIVALYLLKRTRHSPIINLKLPNDRKKKKYNIENLLNYKTLPTDVKLDILGYQNNDPTLAYRKNICIKDYEPGTFTLGEINPDAQFMKNPTTFSNWFNSVFDEEIEVIKRRCPKLIPKKIDLKKLKKEIFSILEYKTDTSKSLKHEIWYQEYSDIIRRILLLCIIGISDYQLDLYPNLTYKRKKITFELLKYIENNKRPNINEWLHLSIAAGLLGVDEKSIHSATSDINKGHIVPLNRPEEKWPLAIERICENLWSISKTEDKIDASEWLFNNFNLSVGIPYKIASFPDDYIETIFLMKFYDELLQKYINIEIDIIPRSIKCGNDATYEDVLHFLNKFSFLKSCTRFRVHKKGPKLATVNLLKLDPSIMTLVEQADLIDARGARNYEMMQGINKNVCFGFMVCRDFSESVIGLKSDKTPLVYLKQSSGEKSFSNFRERHKNVRDGMMICPHAAVDKMYKFQGGHLSTYKTWSKEKKERYETNQAFYSKNALDFHKKYGDHLEKEVINYLNAFKGKVLVAGCGSGKEVKYLDSLECNAIGIDFSFEAIKIARSLHPGLWAQFEVEDLYNIGSFEESSFDGAVLNASLVHLLKKDDLETILSNIKAVLKKDGIGFLRVIEKEGVISEYDKVLFKYPRWFVYYTLNELETVCNDLSLSILKSDRIPHVQHENVFWISILFKK